jgi:hypothetical protein
MLRNMCREWWRAASMQGCCSKAEPAVLQVLDGWRTSQETTKTQYRQPTAWTRCRWGRVCMALFAQCACCMLDVHLPRQQAHCVQPGSTPPGDAQTKLHSLMATTHLAAAWLAASSADIAPKALWKRSGQLKSSRCILRHAIQLH